jgi:phosphate-selective porin OprO/OprP
MPVVAKNGADFAAGGRRAPLGARAVASIAVAVCWLTIVSQVGTASEPSSAPRLLRLPPVTDAPQPLTQSPRRAPPAFPATAAGYVEESLPLTQRLESLEARVRGLEAATPTGEGESPGAPVEPLPSKSAVVGSDKSLKATWNHGLELESANKDFRVHVGGRTQFDNSFFSNDPALVVSPSVGGIGRQPDSFQFRRGRLRIEGTAYENFEFAAEYDFVNTLAPASPDAGQPVVAVPGITDLWGTLTHLPRVGNFRFGSMKEPIGMEHITSSRFLPFIERSFLQDAVFGPFNNGFTPGVMIFDIREDQRATWAIGWFSAQNSIFGYGIGPESAVTGRLTWLAIYDEPSQGRYLWHLGLAGSVRGADEGQARLRTRGNIRSGPPGVLNPIYADTGAMAASTLDYFAFETALNAGPLTIQGEFTGIVVNDAVQPYQAPAVPVDRGNPLFCGGYVQALWFLTGEHSNYSVTRATFDRLTPYENFFLVRSRSGVARGRGAWQIGARYDAIKLNANGINGGILHGFTFGVNWYWNPNMKVQLNYDLTHRSPVQQVPSGFINAWGLRYAMDF